MKASSADNPYRRGYISSLSNTRSPLSIFQCGVCLTLIGNSSYLLSVRSSYDFPRSPDKRFLLFTSLQNVLSFSEKTYFDQDGVFQFCTYKQIKCERCDSRLGKLFIATTKETRDLLDCYCITESAILTYTVGQVAPLSAAKMRQRFLKNLQVDSPSNVKTHHKSPVPSPIPQPPQLSMIVNPESSVLEEEVEEDSKRDFEAKYRSPLFRKKNVFKRPESVQEVEEKLNEFHEIVAELQEDINTAEEAVRQIQRHT